MFSAIKKISKLLGNDRKKVVILLIISLFGACLEAVGVSMMVPLVSVIINPDVVSSNTVIAKVCNFFGIGTYKWFIVACIIAIIVVFLFKDVFLMVEYYFQTKIVYNNRLKTQIKIFKSYTEQPYEFFLNVKSGDVVRTINDDILNSYTMLMSLLSFFSESLMAIILLITVFLIDWFIPLLITIVLTILVVVINKVIKPILSKKGSTLWRANAARNKWVIQALHGIKEIKITNKEDFYEQEFEKACQKCSSANKWRSFLDIIPKYLIEIGCVSTTLFAIALIVVNGENVSSLVASLGAFAMAAVKLLPIANRMVTAYSSIVFSTRSLDNIVEHIDRLSNTTEQHGTTSRKQILRDCIELKKITYKYPNGNGYVLKNACLKVPKGKSVGIIGESGAGKTTAADILMGLLKPESGQILFDGIDLQDNYYGWLKSIGYIPQSIFMMDASIKQNICFGNPEDEKQIIKVLKQAQLYDFVKSLPDGLDTEIGERGLRLSGGQLQRLGIARALYNNPSILVFDEATSSLDNKTEESLMEAINALHGSKTMIIIAHRLQTISKCDFVYKVSGGKIKLQSKEA